MTALSSLYDAIKQLENTQYKIQCDIVELRKAAMAVQAALSKPEVRGETYPDLEERPDSMKQWGDKFTIQAYARYSPYNERWYPVVEMEIDGKSGACDPEVLDAVDTPELAVEIANQTAKLMSEKSKTVV